MKKRIIIPWLLLLMLALLAGCGGEEHGSTSSSSGSSSVASSAPTPTPTPTPTPAPTPTPTPTPTPASVSFAGTTGYRAENAGRYAAYAAQNPSLAAQKVVSYVNIGLDQPFYTAVDTIADPNSLLVLCNKYHKLPDGYEPADLVQISAGHSNGGKTIYLRAEAAAAFEQLCNGAAAQGYTILGQSGYRSYSYQNQIYNNYVARDGQAEADTYSARPGFSEHQTGLAMDICNGRLSYTEFGQTAEYEWAKQHLHEYGFVLHYLPGTQQITGYMTEEWHIRYVGTEVATEIYRLGITLDEYLATYAN